MEKKQVIIIGAGLSSAVIANQLAKKKYDVIVYEKNNFIGGNCYDFFKNKVLIHRFGPHIFHTNDQEVYSFICQFTKLNNFVNKVLVKHKNIYFPLPINFSSIKKIDPINANYIIKQLKLIFKEKKIITLFDLKMINDKKIKHFYNFIYKNVYANYTAKMWNTPFNKVDQNTINRVKILLSDEHNYFPTDQYQGLPINGYTTMIKKMFKHKNIKLCLKTNGLKKIKFDFKKKKIYYQKKIFSGLIFYCGSLDEAGKYQFGKLPYRNLQIKFNTIKKNQYQPTAVVNYPSHPTMTRITEYKHMTMQKNPKNLTIISKEYPSNFETKKKFSSRFYPIINQKNLLLFDKYMSLFKDFKNFYPIGRLALYKYFDMDDAIKYALTLSKQFN